MKIIVVEENKILFDGLYIKNSPVFVEQGKYPVIFNSFKGLVGDTLEKLIDILKLKISKLFSEYRGLIKEFDKFDTILFEKMILRENISESLLILTDILCRYYKEQVIILIYEYDAPLTYAYGHGYYKEAVEFFKALYSNTLKTNSNLKMGVLTGAIRVAQAIY
ncbi:AAA family ATPase [Fusobacterium sp.]|uniref:AAA family ATPase n=1 Tax=Fusobacterium sp. TaxID=68766 RepID=UPI00260BF14A|nr:AAA family ATPase [Fusobacterium sp.]